MSEQQIEYIKDDEETLIDAETARSEKKKLDNMPVLTLGQYYVNDLLDADQSSADLKTYNLDLYAHAATGSVRLRQAAPAPQWPWAESRQLGNLVSEIVQRVKHQPGDIWLDINSGSGDLLQQVPTDFVKIGIDPRDNTDSNQIATVVRQSFSAEAWRASGYDTEKARIITCTDIPDQPDFFNTVADILHEDGILVLQFNYTPLMIQQLRINSLSVSKANYHSLTSIYTLIMKAGLDVVDADVNDVNGGSLRLYAVKPIKEPKFFGTAQLRCVCDYRVDALLSLENYADITNVNVWNEFGKRINQLKAHTLKFLTDELAKGKTVYGWGADLSGQTLIQFLELTNQQLVAIADTDERKWGKKTAGSEIPVCSTAELLENKPDYILVLNETSADDIVPQLTEYLQAGTAVIIPGNELEVISKHGL